MQASTHLGEVDACAARGGWGHPYDANGNVTSKSGEATYAWDFENRLTSVTMNGGAQVSHVYDADGNRVQTTVTPSGGAAAVANYLVDTSGALSQVVADTDGSGNLTAYYVRLGDELLAVMRPQVGPPVWSTRFVHSDGLGSVRTLTDEGGSVSDSRGYEAFGTKNAETGSDPLTYGFAGEPFEGTSNLAYHRARWMDARVGRFEGMDPWEGDPRRPSSLHRYMYASANPANLTDPMGRDDLGDFDAIGDMVSIGATLAGTSFTAITSQFFGGGAHYRLLNYLGPYYQTNAETSSKLDAVFSLIPDAAAFQASDVRVDMQFMEGVRGETSPLGSHLVTISTGYWTAEGDEAKYMTLAHEFAHVLQYQLADRTPLPFPGFLLNLTRGGPESLHGSLDQALAGVDTNYMVPWELATTPISSLNLLDPRFTLDQICERVAWEFTHTTNPDEP